MIREVEEYARYKEQLCRENDKVAPRLFDEYGVYRGLRDEKGVGVLTGLTNISKVISTKFVDGGKKFVDGELWYRGYRVEELIDQLGPLEFGFGKIAYLLLMGQLPNPQERQEFSDLLAKYRTLPTNFNRDVIMKAPTGDIMNSMTKSILTLASYDKDAKDTSLANVLRQCIQLIAELPLLAVYGYNAYNHYERGNSMFIHHPKPELGTAENILMLLRPDQKYTPIEAKVLDTALILHMEHGGGNNSTFTTRVVTSTGSDTYSTMAAAMSSLKGPKHGGANIKVMEMMKDIRGHVKDFSDKDEVKAYLEKIVNKEAFDKKGLIYGMGHAIYALSDPRERVFKSYVEKLVEEKGRQKDFELYENIELLAPDIIAGKRNTYKKISPNVDFYSGFVYEMLGIPMELYTAMFAVARIVGWSAHRIEELVCTDKIIRPAYMSVMEEKDIMNQD
ncbi:citrate/2-methylcitrate synthase [Eubacterium oxidoreducens]|uniref:Citrate synthase n=1 Tax=Eubacterium oxidoreducens TaxID=1732 RepID=A0A1G6ACG4_EUBOX|nr:citrate/2-methylcitrate synthase [Eubacterium oxidoreducens]SDB06124.1 citrate synthase [Eubacterium oxidoreducens]